MAASVHVTRRRRIVAVVVARGKSVSSAMQSVVSSSTAPTVLPREAPVSISLSTSRDLRESSKVHYEHEGHVLSKPESSPSESKMCHF